MVISLIFVSASAVRSSWEFHKSKLNIVQWQYTNVSLPLEHNMGVGWGGEDGVGGGGGGGGGVM